MLSGDLYLAAESAKALIGRGFSEYIGVDVCDIPAKDNRASREIILDNGNPVANQMKLHRLVPLYDDVISHSNVVETPNGADSDPKIPLFPGVTSYKNKLGGRVVVFSGTPEARFVYTEAFSFLNESRKLQLVNLLKGGGNLPVYYPADQEVYLKAATTPNGELFVAFTNISLDPIENIELVCDREINYVKTLMPSGKFRDVEFDIVDGVLCVDAEAPILTPMILIIG